MPSAALPWRHLLLALAVVAVWGTNFVVIERALRDLPPLALAALRFSLATLPVLVFRPRPDVPLRDLAAYGMLIGAGQFGLLYLAMTSHISPGLASLVVQTQVFFTIGLSARQGGERLRPLQWLALALAAGGLALIATHTDGSTTPLGLGLVLVAAACWAGGNQVAKRSGRIDMLPYVVWSSAFAAAPLWGLSLVFEGPQAIAAGMAQADLGTWVAVLWQTAGNTLFGYAAWGWLLARHPAAAITPMALGVPLFGLGASALWLGEPLSPWKLAAAAMVIGGLALNLWGPALWGRLARAG